MAWNAAINLTAVREPGAIAVRHVADSLTGLAVLRARGIDRLVDLGSGGGFPGMTLAAALPADRALLVESVAKKARFLATVVAATGLGRHVAAVPDRAETVAAGPADRGRWPAVTARAVAPLAELVELAFPLLEPGGVLVAWKRGPVDDRAGLGGELDAAARALDAIDPGGRIEVRVPIPAGVATNPAIADLADHILVIVERGRGTVGDLWPRDMALRSRRPW